MQIFALVGLCSNIVWAILWTLLCWNPEWALSCPGSKCKGTNCPVFVTDVAVACTTSMLIKLASAFSYLSALGFIGSNVLSIYEGNKKDLIKPLKIAAVVCATYEMLYFTIMTFVDFDSYFDDAIFARFGALAGFVGFAWIIIVIVALVLSKGEKNKKSLQEKTIEKEEPGQKKDNKEKTDDELRAEIEEQVRREMIEKEVRARMEAERGKENKED